MKERIKAGWNRVWAKGKTIVVGTAVNTQKEFSLEYIITADPNYTFGGIHAGMSVKNFKSVLKTTDTPYTDLIEQSGYTCLNQYGLIDDENTKILHPNGSITQIGYFPASLSISNSTAAFVKSQMKSMGLREFPND